MSHQGRQRPPCPYSTTPLSTIVQSSKRKYDYQILLLIEAHKIIGLSLDSKNHDFLKSSCYLYDSIIHGLLSMHACAFGQSIVYLFKCFSYLKLSRYVIWKMNIVLCIINMENNYSWERRKYPLIQSY